MKLTRRRILSTLPAILVRGRAATRKTNVVMFMTDALVLDPRTNDRSPAMTSSFSNLLLAGLWFADGGRVGLVLPDVSERVFRHLPALEDLARLTAAKATDRIAILTPPALVGAGREAALKILEMTGGCIVPLADLPWSPARPLELSPRRHSCTLFRFIG